MTTSRSPDAADPKRRTVLVLGAAALPPAIVAAVIGVLLGGIVGLVVAFVVVAAALVALVWARAGRVGDVGGEPADAVRHARLLNLVDGLCVGAGVRMPMLRVLDTAGCNLAVVGRDAGHASLIVTSGLLDDLTRMELEGALATGIVELRRGDARPATVAAAAGPLAVRLAVDSDRDRVIDEAAAALTRYPPGLTAAYRKLQRNGTAVPGTPRRAAHLWLADPDRSKAPVAYRISLQERIDNLAEL